MSTATLDSAMTLSIVKVARVTSSCAEEEWLVQVVMAYTVGIAACLAAFYFTPASWTVVQWTTVFFIGFFLYGPQMLIGLCGAELVSTPAQSGISGPIHQLGMGTVTPSISSVMVQLIGVAQ